MSTLANLVRLVEVMITRLKTGPALTTEETSSLVNLLSKCQALCEGASAKAFDDAQLLRKRLDAVNARRDDHIRTARDLSTSGKSTTESLFALTLNAVLVEHGMSPFYSTHVGAQPTTDIPRNVNSVAEALSSTWSHAENLIMHANAKALDPHQRMREGVAATLTMVAHKMSIDLTFVPAPAAVPPYPDPYADKRGPWGATPRPEPTSFTHDEVVNLLVVADPALSHGEANVIVGAYALGKAHE